MQLQLSLHPQLEPQAISHPGRRKCDTLHDYFPGPKLTHVQKRIVSGHFNQFYEEYKTTQINVHHFGLKRLYCGPRCLIIVPNITKFAARRGVGPRMVHVILTYTTVNKKGIDWHQNSPDVLHLERRRKRWREARPQPCCPSQNF